MSTGLAPNQYPIQSALGIVPGTVIGIRIGRNDNVPSTSFIILSNVTSGAFPSNQPAAAQQMQIVSSSALDVVAGAFAQQVTITYLTAPFPTNTLEPFKRKTETVTLTGLVPVLTNATDIFRIDKFVVSRAGANGVAAGNISLQNTLGTITFERINAGENTGESAVHYVEKGFGSLVTDMVFGCSTTAGVELILVVTEIDSAGNHVGIGQVELELASSAITKTFQTPRITKNPDGKEVFYIMAVKGRAANQTVSGSFTFIDFPL